MTFQNSHVRFYVSLIGSGEGGHTTHLLKCGLLLSISQTDWKQSSNILSNIFFDILSNISSDILSDISFEPRKKPWLVGLYKGLYYPVIWGL